MRLPDVGAFLLQSWDRSWDRKTLLWLAASLVLAGFLSLAGLKIAFSQAYVIQGDARQYSLFFQQIKEKEMFQSDLIARYYNSVIPTGFKFLYRTVAWFGIDPFFFNKIIPFFLALILTCYIFALTLEIFPVPLAGFLAAVLLNQNLWTKEDLSNGTPRSFAVPFFVIFLYYFIRKAWILCLLLIVLQALFFPPVALVSICMLGLRLWDRTPERRKHRFLVLLAAAILTATVLIPYAVRTSTFGPVITKAEARNHSAFRPGGRQPFFNRPPVEFWLTGHSGLFHYGLRPPLIFAGFLLPFLWKWKSCRFADLRLLAEVIAASLLMFAIVHLSLFYLYNPSRYTQHTLPIVMAVAAGISLTFLLQTLFQWNRNLGWAGLLIGTILLIVQFEKIITYGYGYRIYVKGQEPELYDFLHSHAKNKLVATLSRETDNLPAFASCATVVGWEYADPYHTGYYRQIQERGEDLILAQYDERLTEMKNFISKYRVDFLLVDRNAFQTSYFDSNPWVRRVFPHAAEIAETRLKQGISPALTGVMNSCMAWQNERLVLLQATCVIQSDS